MKKWQRRWLSMVLCSCLLAVILPFTQMTYASETECTHIHDENCGYKENAGRSCTHSHDENCGESRLKSDLDTADNTSPNLQEVNDKQPVPLRYEPAVYGLTATGMAEGGNVYDAQTLVTALGGSENVTINKSVVTLKKNVNLKKYMVVYNTSLTLNLNGFTLGAHDEIDVGIYEGMIAVTNGELTIRNGTISNTSDDNSTAIRMYNNSGMVQLDNVALIEGNILGDKGSTLQINGNAAIRGNFMFSGTVKIANGSTLDLTEGSLAFAESRRFVLFKQAGEPWDTNTPLVLANKQTSDWLVTLDSIASSLPDGYSLAYVRSKQTSSWILQEPGHKVDYHLADHVNANSTPGSVVAGSTLSITLTADAGYRVIHGNIHVYEIVGNDKKKRGYSYDEKTGVLTIDNISTDLQIEVLEKIVVTSDTVKNGQIKIEDNAGQTTISSEFLAVQQEKIIIRGNPDAGYQLSSLTVNGNAFESGSVYTVTDPTMIKAVFEPVLTPVEVAPKITTTSLKSGMETAAYQELLGASGSTPITWSVVKGRFPDGLTLTASGHIKGTPVIPGTYRFTLRAANSAGSDEKEFTIEIRPLPNGTNYRYKSLNDPVSGITVNGVFSSDAELRIKRNQGLHEEGTCAACDDIRARQKRGELMALYDISLTAGTYQGEVEVSIPLQQAGEEETVYFLHCNHKTEERRMIKVSDGTVTGTFSSLSPFAVAKVSEKKTITGLPKSHTMSVGESVSWTPKPAGGTWSYDKNMLEMSQSGDVYTFTALQTGKTTATYTVDGVTHSVNISMISSNIPKTGDTTNSVIWMLGIAASVLCCFVLVSNRKHENNSRK